MVANSCIIFRHAANHDNSADRDGIGNAVRGCVVPQR